MKRWTSISPTNEEHRWQTLSAKLNALGLKNEYVEWTGSTSSFEDLQSLEGFDHVRLSTRLGPEILKKLKVQSSWSTLIGVIDGMVKTEFGWWPLCGLYESFGQLLIHHGQSVDPRGSILIAGAGGAARAAIGAFFRAGFSKFLLTNFVVGEADTMMAEVRGKFFGLDIEFVPMEKIVLLSGDCSALVNCTPGIEENALLLELSYLNFLKRPGILFDLNRYNQSSVLVQEALDAGVNVIDGVEIGARADILWAKWAFQVDLDLADYKQEFQSSIKS